MNFLRRSQQAVPHQKLGGRYKVINQLGVGGFSQTFLAQDLHLPGHPLCVVKQFKPQVADPIQLQTASRLFDTEAKVLYQLGEHPQIPRLLAHFEEEQEFYLVQEFIEGQPLGKLLTGHPWSQQRVVALLQDLLQVLVFVHQQSVIHRDIKPSNLMYRNHDGRIVLIDFGAVKQVSTQLTESSTGLLTVSIGTQGYMPMEQLSGNPRFSSDIYAAGVVCIQALTGMSPKRFKSDLQTGEIVWRDLCPDPHTQSNVNLDFAAILDRMVCYHFKDRYQTAEEALQALEALIAECPELAEPEAVAASTELTGEQLLTLHQSELPLPEADSAPPVSEALVDEPTHSLAAPVSPPVVLPPVTELATDPPTEATPAETTETDAAADEQVDPQQLDLQPTGESTQSTSGQAKTTAFDAITAANPATAEPTIAEPIAEPSEPIADPATLSSVDETSSESVFPTAVAPTPDGSVSTSTFSSPPTVPIPQPNEALPEARLEAQPEVQPEAQPAIESSPESSPPVSAGINAASDEGETAYATPMVSAEEPTSLWQRSRFLPWTLLVGVGLVALVAIPFFSRFLPPKVQSGISPASLADLPCQEPSLPELPSGEADYEYPDGTRYYGPITQGLPTDGKAIMVFPSGNRYDGEFQNGQRNGCGTLSFSNGRSYMGQFEDDQFNGQGVWTLETGERYVGDFLDNRCHGEGTFFFTDGTSEQGRWEDGEQIDGDLKCDP